VSESAELNKKCARAARQLARGRGRVHLLGICGVGTAGVAFQLKQRGFQVSGCDRAPGALAAWLEARGIPVSAGHAPAHLAGADWLVRSTAVRPDDPELAAAAAKGIPVIQRGLVLAVLLSGTNSVAVSGTHGKTTTTSMIIQVLRAGGRSPSFCIGGESAKLGGVAGAGAGGILVAEADESDGTLAAYAPAVGVITNIEFDHAEHFKNLAALRACFREFAGRVRRRLVFCADDPEARRLGLSAEASAQAGEGNPKAVSYGLSAPADWRAARLVESSSAVAFDVICRGIRLGRLRLPVPGRHNALNALAACAVAEEYKIKFADVSRALGRFEPVRRRFERVWAGDDLLVISDYAHHPTEIATVLRNLRQIRRKRWLAVFQPHRFSRTLALGKDFAGVFEGLDELILLPVYAASEPELTGGTSWDLYAHLRQAGKVRVLAGSSPEQAWGYLRGYLARGDGLLIIGAGDIGRLATLARTDLRRAGLKRLDPAAAWLKGLASLKLKNTRIRLDESLARKTTLHVGGKADIYLEVQTPAELARIIAWAAEVRAPWAILGAGSNLLASDLGVRGLVIRLTGAAFRGIRADGPTRVIAGAATPLPAGGAGRPGIFDGHSRDRRRRPAHERRRLGKEHWRGRGPRALPGSGRHGTCCRKTGFMFYLPPVRRIGRKNHPGSGLGDNPRQARGGAQAHGGVRPETGMDARTALGGIGLPQSGE
jgi:UDP-N-acetylmuramate--alanine ligase